MVCWEMGTEVEFSFSDAGALHSCTWRAVDVGVWILNWNQFHLWSERRFLKMERNLVRAMGQAMVYDWPESWATSIMHTDSASETEIQMEKHAPESRNVDKSDAIQLTTSLSLSEAGAHSTHSHTHTWHHTKVCRSCLSTLVYGSTYEHRTW